ncbi:Spy/CpxP family protein refolding chaperone [Marinigracilibium pacificum]|uniref:LTXXQ motif family protein n=1 Tax=Marinigracilibium pacificum TaxID=2729599 RepID=A0A848IUI6_9BACT|nr:Spy/CpxP family protein refolding chaperone [Marinigracilibium pacificum]NMM47997.1 hypothetical protein [Marinigracilibium pacificum]
MRYILLFFGLIIIGYSGLAQDGPAKERIESARIAYITNKVDLTPEQAQQFWPVYNQFLHERASLRNELRDLRGNRRLNELSEEEQKQLLDKNLEIKVKEAELEKKYSDKLLKLISPAQLIELHQAEREFKELLLERIGERARRRQNN